MINEMQKDRKELFEKLRDEARSELVVRQVDFYQLESRGHSLWVWDATRLPTSGPGAPFR